MLHRLKTIDVDSWLGLVCYLTTVYLLYLVTNAAVSDSVGALIFSMFMGLGAAVPVYLAARFVRRRAVRAYRETRREPVQEEAPSPSPVENGGHPERRFRLARHGSVDPAYGRPKSPESTESERDD